jgi:hypothetical protein
MKRNEWPDFSIERLNWRIKLALSVFIVLIFGIGDILILSGSSFPHLYSVIETPSSQFEEAVIYLPFANSFGLQNLLPAAPGFDPSTSGLTVYPAITIIIQGIIFRLLCFGSIDIYLLLIHTIIPLVSFWIVYTIFRRFISISWSITLAFWAITYHADFHFAGYILALLRNPGQFISLSSAVLPEITRVPFPSYRCRYFAQLYI